MKNHRKLLLLLFGISCCFFIFFLAQTYAKYLTSASGNAEISIAKWNILVNNTSIKNNSDISSCIIPVFPGNDNISSNVIAPNAEGYFDLDLNFKDADVSFEYEINTEISTDSSIKDLVTTGYSFDNGEKVTFTNFNTPIKETIYLNSNIQNRKIRIYVLWNDDDLTQTMSNLEDTTSSASSIPAAINVNISFTQIK